MKTDVTVAKNYLSEQEMHYLERIVSPSEPDKPTEPKRWLALLTVFASSLLVYAVGWLVWAGVREHRQD